MTVEVLRSASIMASAAAATATLHVSASTRRTKAVLQMDPVLDEIERRAEAGLGGILDESLLEALLVLPVDIPVPAEALHADTQRELSAAPSGCVDFVDETVIRRAMSPIRVLSAGVCAATWSDGLSQAGQFASYCERYAVLTSPADDLDHAAMEASFYGIGLATMTRGSESLQWIVRPGSFRPTRETVASWHFAESAFEAMLQSPERLRA